MTSWYFVTVPGEHCFTRVAARGPFQSAVSHAGLDCRSSPGFGTAYRRTSNACFKCLSASAQEKLVDAYG
jgi:hypothetical protein